MKFLPYDKPHFLMPAHDHDPADVSNLTDLPLPVSGPLPKEVRELLPAVQEATSIVFASFNRLDNLLSQRLERLSVVRDENRNPDGEDVQYSEPAYFWYQNQVMSEVQYLVTEALPDWKHKFTRLEHECLRQGIMLDPEKAQNGANAEFAKWFWTLKDEVQEWKRIAEAVEVPDFDHAVADLTAMQIKRKASRLNRTSPILNGKSPNVNRTSSNAIETSPIVNETFPNIIETLLNINGSSPIVESQREVIRKIEKVDSGIDF